MYKKIEINKVSIEGFKGYKERVEFPFSLLTRISAGNGKGKTSIGEAIVWAFLGSNLWGNDKVDAMLLNKESKSMAVTVEFNEDNINHKITRTKKANSTSIILDNKTKKQNEVTELIGSKEIFLSIFNPEYFLSKSDKEGRDFLISILKDIPITEVTQELDQYSYNFIKDDLVSVHADPNNFMKEKRSEIKELEKDIIFAEGVISNLDTNDEAFEKKVYDSSDIEDLEERLANLTINPDLQLKNEIEDYKNKKQELELEKASLVSAEYSSTKDTSNEKIELLKIENSISSLNMEKYDVSDQVKKEIFTLENNLEELRKKYRKAKDLPLKKGDKCPTCKTVISEPHLLILKDEVSSQLLELEKEAGELSKRLLDLKDKTRATIIGLEEIRNKKKNELEEKRSKLNDKIILLEKEIEQEMATFKKIKESKLKELEGKIKHINQTILEKQKQIEKELIENTEKLETKKTFIKDRLLVLKKEKMEVDVYNIELESRLEKKLRDKEKLDKTNKEIDLANKMIGIKNTQIDVCKQYTSIKIGILSDLIHNNLKDVTIELQRLVKSTGELKDSFEINYKAKSHKLISASEKIKTGIEISNLVRNLTGLEYPIFIDNKESITSYDKPNVQIIEAKVVDDRPIEVIVSGEKIA